MANPRSQKIGDFLVKAKVIDDLQLRSALAQHEQWGGRLAHVVAEMGLAQEERIVETLARAMNVQRIRLGNIQKDAGALGKIDVGFADEKCVFPVQLRDNGKVMLIAMADPTDLETIDEVGRRSRARVQAYIAGEREIKGAIDRHYRGMEGGPTAPRHSREVPAAGGGEDEDEFKIVDMSGKTVMKKLSDIDPGAAKEEPARTAPPVDLSADIAGGPSASDLLDDILGGGESTAQLSPEDLQRLQTVRANQEKSAKILRAVMELLTEKGVVTPQQVQGRVRQ